MVLSTSYKMNIHIKISLILVMIQGIFLGAIYFHFVPLSSLWYSLMWGNVYIYCTNLFIYMIRNHWRESNKSYIRRVQEEG